MKKLLATLFLVAQLLVFSPVAHGATDVVNDASLGTNLVSCYDLNEASGTRADSKGTNSMSAVNAPGSATGVIGDGVDLESGSSQYLQATDSATLSITGAFSIAAWVKLESEANFDPFISKWSETSNKRTYAIHYLSDVFRFIISSDGSSTFSVSATTPISTGTWYHVAVSYEPSTALKIYVNGTLENTNSTGIPAAVYDGDIATMIGRANPFGGADDYFDGVVDGVRIWNKVITLAEVQADRNSGSGLPCIATATPQPTRDDVVFLE